MALSPFSSKLTNSTAGSDTVKPATLALAPASDPSPDLLHSDDEETGYVVPITLRGLTHYAPALPPKHTYLRTPVGIVNLI